MIRSGWVQDVAALGSANVVPQDVVQCNSRAKLEAIDFEGLALGATCCAETNSAGGGRPRLSDSDSHSTNDASAGVSPQLEVNRRDGSARSAWISGMRILTKEVATTMIIITRIDIKGSQKIS